jgi:hypothetical protein
MLRPLNPPGKNSYYQLVGRPVGPQVSMDVARKRKIVLIPETRKPVAQFVVNEFSASVALLTSKYSNRIIYRKYFECLVLNM